MMGVGYGEWHGGRPCRTCGRKRRQLLRGPTPVALCGARTASEAKGEHTLRLKSSEVSEAGLD